MSTPAYLRGLEALGLRLVPVGGRPPKTTRDVAVYSANCWFQAGAVGKRPKLGQAVVDLWLSKAYPGISDPAHVVARKPHAVKAIGADHAQIVFKGDGTNRRRVGDGAGVLLVPTTSISEEAAGVLRFHGPVWSWTFGAETADFYEATGVVEYPSKT